MTGNRPSESSAVDGYRYRRRGKVEFYLAGGAASTLLLSSYRLSLRGLGLWVCGQRRYAVEVDFACHRDRAAASARDWDAASRTPSASGAAAMDTCREVGLQAGVTELVVRASAA